LQGGKQLPPTQVPHVVFTCIYQDEMGRCFHQETGPGRRQVVGLQAPLLQCLLQFIFRGVYKKAVSLSDDGPIVNSQAGEVTQLEAETIVHALILPVVYDPRKEASLKRDAS